MLGRSALLTLLLPFAAPSLLEADEELWLWADVDWWQDETWRGHLYLDQRLSRDRGSYVQIVSPRFKRHLQPWLDLGLGLSYLHLEQGDSNDFVDQARPEFEVNFKLHWTDLRFHSRNRWEIRWNDWGGRPSHRIRNRIQLAWDLTDASWFKGVYSNNEFFFDAHSGRWSENRWIPLGLSFRITPRATLHLYYMNRGRHHPGSWSHDHIAGSFLSVKL